MAVRIRFINESDAPGFVDLLGDIFEHSPWVAERAYLLGPFSSIDNLHEAMVHIVRQASPEMRLKLLRQHPELAGREAAAGSLTDASKREQAGAGLNQCSAEELARIEQLNHAYAERFEFPFIIAVSGLDKAQIIAAMERRLENSPEEEFATALDEVEKIALLRLNKLILPQ
jgi:2-oxo-4-hydroxy-4-carboxy-5-ureidoimidazoline decarboxylase